MRLRGLGFGARLRLFGETHYKVYMRFLFVLGEYSPHRPLTEALFWGWFGFAAAVLRCSMCKCVL